MILSELHSEPIKKSKMVLFGKKFNNRNLKVLFLQIALDVLHILLPFILLSKDRFWFTTALEQTELHTNFLSDSARVATIPLFLNFFLL